MPNHARPDELSGIRICSKCNIAHPLSFYYVTIDKRDGKPYRYSRCNDCSRAMARAWQRKHPEKCIEHANNWRLKNPEKAKEISWKSQQKWRQKPENRARHLATGKRARLKRMYSLTESQVEEMRCRQNNACASCGTTDKRLVIDHDHESGKVRGLVCDACNHMIGFIETRQEDLRKCEAFLAQWKEKSNA